MAKRPTLVSFRDPELSLWQSTVDQIVTEDQRLRARSAGAGEGQQRPDLSDPLVRSAAFVAEALANADVLAGPVPGVVMRGVEDTARFCAATALRLARARVRALLTGDDREVRRLEEQIGSKFSQCDPRWAECVEVFVRARAEGKTIPFRRENHPEYPFVIDRLPANARIALVGDWGTGEDAARLVLKRIAARKPHVVVHLGDIYYSGTEHEVRQYFYPIWQAELGVPLVQWGEKLTVCSTGPLTFSLSGNHDMYGGGAPYYTLIDMLGQPSSYFCLRNDRWQLIGLDTGFHDSAPIHSAASVTRLEDPQTAWLQQRIAEAGGRKSFLVSHHQLFSAAEKFNGDSVNQQLFAQVKDVLPKVTAWFWGHEHDLVVFERYAPAGNVLGRCVGHGAFPVAVDEQVTRDPQVKLDSRARPLTPDRDGGLFNHGFAIVELNDAAQTATAEYYQQDTDDPAKPEELLFRETV